MSWFDWSEDDLHDGRSFGGAESSASWDIRVVLASLSTEGGQFAVAGNGLARWCRVRCPFHSDRSPSASISTEHNAFRCFSCGLYGNPVTLVARHLGISNREAVRWLEANVGQSQAEEVEEDSWSKYAR